MLLPLGSDERETHAPRATLVLVALNLLVFLATQGFDLDKAERQQGLLEEVASWTLREAGQRVPALAARTTAPALAFLERDSAWRGELSRPEYRELRDRLEAAAEDARKLRGAHPFHRFGFVPARITPLTLVSHQFLHAGVLHIAFNMLFLWTVGGLLERTLGVVRFLAVYLVGGMAAALAHAALNPASTEPAVGASGAVAGVMGAYAVLHAR